MKKQIGLSTALLLAASTLTQANEADDDDFELSIGAGVVAYQSIYLGGKNQTSPFPYIEAEWGPLYFSGGDLGVYVAGSEKYGLALSIGISGDFIGDTEYGDSPELKDMGELDDVINATINVMWETDVGEFQLSYAKDVSNRHDGDTISVEYSKMFNAGNFHYGPTISYAHNSDEVTQYYYGVSEKFAKPGRAFYRPGASSAYSVGLVAAYQFDQHNSIMGFAEASFYDKEITDSPIVNDDNAMVIGAVYQYRF